MGRQVAFGYFEDCLIGYDLRNPKEVSQEIWLWPKGHKNKAVRLCETCAWGNMSLTFSPDNYWIIVQDGGGSLGVSLRLFRRSKGVTFHEVKEANIDGKAERLALKQNGLRESDDFLDHRYVLLLSWSKDSRMITVELSGRGRDAKHDVEIEGWKGIYDLAKNDFTAELQKKNRGTVKVVNR